ncbi:hypothetical protein V8E53_011181, partial [Lactarius tabidus]
ILTVFQIQDAEKDPLTRTAALCTLVVSALMSLLFRIVYIVCFNNMRSIYHASRWTKVCCTLCTLVNSHSPPTLQEAQKTKTAIFQNVWVLALPVICRA